MQAQEKTHGWLNTDQMLDIFKRPALVEKMQEKAKAENRVKKHVDDVDTELCPVVCVP